MKVYEQVNSIVASYEADIKQAQADNNEELVQRLQQELDDFTGEAQAQMRD